MSAIFSALWNRFGGAIVALGALLAGLLYAFSKGRESAQKTAEIEKAHRDAEVAKKTQTAMQGKIDAQDYVSNLPAGAAADELRKHWNADPNDGHGV